MIFLGAIMTKDRLCQRNKVLAKAALVSTAYLVLAAASLNEVRGQASAPAQQPTQSDELPAAPSTPSPEAPATQPDASPSPEAAPVQPQPDTTPLSQVTVQTSRSKPRSTSTPAQTAERRAPPPPDAPPPSAPPTNAPSPAVQNPSAAIQAAWPASGTQDARTGTVGVYANSTSVATKVNTPMVNIPQSLSVVTREFISDTSFQNLTDITRYVPGVAVHQGEGNRDELIIRGVDSSANFFVNGFRDDVQIFRDLYNAQSVEILKGPSAITFGRGSGGGL